MWYPTKLSKAVLDVTTRSAEDAAVQATGAVACFTGGVDSFYTLTSNTGELDRLLYVHGFDIPLNDTEFRARTSQHLNEAAEAAGKKLIEGSTNVRRFLNPYMNWGDISHGAALASVGHLLGSTHSKFFIPASHTYADQYSWGSHPLVDPLWSSERITVIHDGANTTRVGKTRAISSDTSAQRHLRVCWQKTGEYNCGRCEKCLRTKIALRLAGALGQFETMGEEIPFDKVRTLPIRNASDLSFADENLAFAREVGDVEVAEALVVAIDAYRHRAKPSGSAPASPSLSDLATRLARLEKSVTSLDTLWPIRTWSRFARWRRR